jgi:hypothetical protein
MQSAVAATAATAAAAAAALLPLLATAAAAADSRKLSKPVGVVVGMHIGMEGESELMWVHL